jgi:rRNA maturation endonuclease Nob1
VAKQKCQKCEKIWRGWAQPDICPDCGSKLEEVKGKENKGKKNIEKIIRVK